RLENLGRYLLLVIMAPGITYLNLVYEDGIPIYGTPSDYYAELGGYSPQRSSPVPFTQNVVHHSLDGALWDVNPWTEMDTKKAYMWTASEQYKSCFSIPVASEKIQQL
ncbi:7037_t:CDS:2, partial [Acaulospora colombiana]